MASQTTAVKREIMTTVRLSEYLKLVKKAEAIVEPFSERERDFSDGIRTETSSKGGVWLEMYYLNSEGFC